MEKDSKNQNESLFFLIFYTFRYNKSIEKANNQ